VVLPYSPRRLPFDRTAAAAHRAAAHRPASSYAHRATSRSVQLRRWLRKLASGLVSGKEGVVLQSPWQGLPESGRWLRDVI